MPFAVATMLAASNVFATAVPVYPLKLSFPNVSSALTAAYVFASPPFVRMNFISNPFAAVAEPKILSTPLLPRFILVVALVLLALNLSTESE